MTAHLGSSKSGRSFGASSQEFDIPGPNAIVSMISSARSGKSSTRASAIRSVRIAAFPQAMSTPTPIGETLFRYAATPPIGMTYPRWPSAINAARSALEATSLNCSRVLSS